MYFIKIREKYAYLIKIREKYGVVLEHRGARAAQLLAAALHAPQLPRLPAGWDHTDCMMTLFGTM